MIRIIIAWTVCCALWAADDVDALKKRIVELEREVAALKADSISLKAINESGVRFFGVDAGDGVELSAPVVSLLGLTEQQAQGVSKARVDIQKRLLDLARQAGAAASVDGDTCTVVIRDFSAAGKPLRKDLERAVTAQIGAERQKLLAKVYENADESQMLSFGEGEMTLSLPAAAGGQYSFTRTHGGGSSSSSGTSSGLPAQARLLAPLIPKRFGGTLEDAAAGQPAGGHGAHDF
ncbi:MAG: hypothetical protein H0W83_01825 [Planctomycetes bacterium]|nr:hypothetical protein [Planctomycetota bacterium]